MPERLSDVVRAERGNAGAIRILAALSTMASATATTARDPNVQAGALLASGVLRVVTKALQGQLDPDQINIDQLFVKSPTELLQEKGITQDEIDRIIRGG